MQAFYNPSRAMLERKMVDASQLCHGTNKFDNIQLHLLNSNISECFDKISYVVVYNLIWVKALF